MPTLVNLSDVKDYLNIEGSTEDSELQGFLDDAVAAIEDVIGPITAQAVTEVIDSHTNRIVLSRWPVLSVQSVSINPWLGAAATDDTAAWIVNTDTGVLRRQIVGGAMPFYGSGSVFTVAYTVGRSTVPGGINRAILMQVAEMHRSQRGAMALPAGAEPPPPSYVGSVGFLAPAVMELLLPHLPPPGLA